MESMVGLRTLGHQLSHSTEAALQMSTPSLIPTMMNLGPGLISERHYRSAEQAKRGEL